MKRKLIAVILLFFAATCYSQKSKFELGYNIGFTESFFSGHPYGSDKTKNKVGFNYCVNSSVNFYIKDNFSIKSGISYFNSTSVFDPVTYVNSSGSSIRDGSLRKRLQFVNIPLGLEYKLKDTKNPKVWESIGIGYCFGFLAGSKTTVISNFSETELGFPKLSNNSDDLSKFNGSLYLSFGIKKQIGKNKFFSFEGIFYNGLSNLKKGGNTNVNSKLSSLVINLGMSYLLK
jgi:hypothetical protein